MTQNNKTQQYSLYAGILYAVALAFSVFMIRGFTFRLLIGLAGQGAVTFALFTKRRDIILTVGFGLQALISLISLFYGFNIFNVLYFLAWTGMALMAVVELTDYLPQFRYLTRTFYFVPAVIFAVCCLNSLSLLFNIGTYIRYLGFFYTLFSFFRPFVLAAAAFMAALWISNTEASVPEWNFNASSNVAVTSTATNAAPAGDGCCGLLKHILLLLFTFGIWQYIWIYRMTGYTNAANDEGKRDSTVQLLLCLFIPFYSIYWMYKTAQRVDKLAASKGVPCELATLTLVVSFFVPIIPMVLIQDKVNAIAASTAPAPRSSGINLAK